MIELSSGEKASPKEFTQIWIMEEIQAAMLTGEWAERMTAREKKLVADQMGIALERMNKVLGKQYTPGELEGGMVQWVEMNVKED